MLKSRLINLEALSKKKLLVPFSHTLYNRKIEDLNLLASDTFNITTYGRILFKRIHKNTTFIVLRKGKGKIQLIIDNLSEIFSISKLFNVGDILEVNGNVFKNKNGQTSIKVKELKLIAKSVKIYPSKLKFKKIHKENNLFWSKEKRNKIKVKNNIFKITENILISRNYLQIPLSSSFSFRNILSESNKYILNNINKLYFVDYNAVEKYSGYIYLVFKEMIFNNSISEVESVFYYLFEKLNIKISFKWEIYNNGFIDETQEQPVNYIIFEKIEDKFSEKIYPIANVFAHTKNIGKIYVQLPNVFEKNKSYFLLSNENEAYQFGIPFVYMLKINMRQILELISDEDQFYLE